MLYFEILINLKKDKENFLIDEESYVYEFGFNLEDFKYKAIKILDADETLNGVREEIVPDKITEE